MTKFRHLLGFLMLLSFNLYAQNQLVFQVDMRDHLQTKIFDPTNRDSLLLRGSFNNWNGNAFFLSDSNVDSIYTGTFDIAGAKGDVIEYKFVIHKKTGADIWEHNPLPDNSQNGNRKLTLTAEPQTLPLSSLKLDKYSLRFINKVVEFSIPELQEDFQQMRKALEENHPALYEFTDKKSLDNLFEEQFKLIDNPMQPHEFFRILTPITAAIGCGHTNLWMPGEFWKIGFEQFFPLKFEIMEKKVVVTDSYKASCQIPVGSIIIDINGRPICEIINELKSSYSADGFNDNFRKSQVERRFPMLYARVFGFPESYQVTYIPPESNIKQKVELSPANNPSVRAVVFKKPELNFDIIEEKNAAILTINSFSYYDRVPMFRGFIDSCFNEIHEKQIKNLILDLRENDGGDPFCSVPLFSYLEHEAVPYFAEPYGKYSDFADSVPRVEKAFMGNLFTLVNERCFSTNGHFCALLKYHDIGKFVGSETGATYSCNAATKTIKLNHSRFMVFVARGTFAAAVEGMDKKQGISPDYPVEQTIKDFLKGKDTVLEYTFKLIDQKNSSQ